MYIYVYTHTHLISKVSYVINSFGKPVGIPQKQIHWHATHQAKMCSWQFCDSDLSGDVFVLFCDLFKGYVTSN